MKFNQLPVVPSTQDAGVVTPQSSVALVTPVAPAATRSRAVWHLRYLQNKEKKRLSFSQSFYIARCLEFLLELVAC